MKTQGDNENQPTYDDSIDVPQEYVGNLKWMKFQSAPSINTFKIPRLGEYRISHLIRVGKRINNNWTL